MTIKKMSRFAAAIVGIALLITACGGTSTNTSSGGKLAGKKILNVPYWLDTFNTANSYWIGKELQAMGAKYDVVNPNAVSSVELTALETAISSKNYDLIIWAPVDSTSAPTEVRKLQDAHIPQVLNFTSLVSGDNGLNFSAVGTDLKKQQFSAGADAATYVKAHPELGAAKIAYMADFPISEYCRAGRESGFIAGVKSVSPDATVVFEGGAKDQADATTKMQNFITRNIPFNIFGGCGGSVSLGGIAAMKAAGLADAPNKTPKNVYITSMDCTPNELALLWDQNSAEMRCGLVGPKAAAEQAVKLAVDQLTGVTAYNASAFGNVEAIWLTPDCAKYRPLALDQFGGVKGFTIPDCSFTYSGT